MHHYFTNDPEMNHQFRDVSVEFHGSTFTFLTDKGTFSNHAIDEGSLALLRVLLKMNWSGMCLDLGCGYGTIGLILASFFKEVTFLLTDVNMRACELARTNAAKMKLDQRVEVRVSEGFEQIPEYFQAIFLNPPIRAGKKVIYAMFKEAYHHLLPEGKLMIVMRKSHGCLSAATYLTSLFGEGTLLKRDKGYYIYCFQKQAKEIQIEEDLQ